MVISFLDNTSYFKKLLGLAAPCFALPMTLLITFLEPIEIYKIYTCSAFFRFLSTNFFMRSKTFQEAHCNYEFDWMCIVQYFDCIPAVHRSNRPICYFRYRIWNPPGHQDKLVQTLVVALALWSDDFLLRQPWCSKSVLAE